MPGLRWHTRIVSPYGDKHTIVDPMSVRVKVRKRRGDSRYEMRDGVLQKVMPFRGVEVVAHLKRKRNKMDGGKMKAVVRIAQEIEKTSDIMRSRCAYKSVFIAM